MGRRTQQLEDSLKLHQFVHDIEDEMAWIREREPMATSSVLGNSLDNVQNLLKKHLVSHCSRGARADSDKPLVEQLCLWCVC